MEAKESPKRFRMKCTNKQTGEVYVKYPDGFSEERIKSEVAECNKLWPHIKFEAEPLP